MTPHLTSCLYFPPCCLAPVHLPWLYCETLIHKICSQRENIPITPGKLQKDYEKYTGVKQYGGPPNIHEVKRVLILIYISCCVLGKDHEQSQNCVVLFEVFVHNDCTEQHISSDTIICFKHWSSWLIISYNHQSLSLNHLASHSYISFALLP